MSAIRACVVPPRETGAKFAPVSEEPAPEIAEMEPIGSILPATESPHARAASSVRDALRDVDQDLADRRERRDALNDEIRVLVEQRATLRAAAGAFERRAKAEAAARSPRRETEATS
jgi:hypothetical protein